MPGFFDPLPQGNDGRGWSVDQLRLWHKGEGNGTNLAWGVLGYEQVEANQTGITTEVDLTGLSVTISTPGNRRIKVTGHTQFTASNANALAQMYIHIGGSQIQRNIYRTITNENRVVTAIAVEVPSAGSHTFKLRAAVSAGTLDLQAAADRPAFILAEDIGPA